MKRPTIEDLAEASGVSVSTVNRALAGKDNVREVTMQRIADAAESIGFYGQGAIKSRMAANRPKYRLGFILLQKHREFYQRLARSFFDAVHSFTDRQIEIEILHLEDLSPHRAEDALRKLAKTCDAIAIIFPQSPEISVTIDQIVASGTPVLSLITPLTTNPPIGFVGVDNWKAGRTAGWAMDHLCHEGGELAILVGNARFRNQELNEIGFRSYIHEFGERFKILEPVSTYEIASIAEEATERLIRENSDLRGIFIAGGGITGALEAIRKTGKSGKIITVGFEFIDVTRRGLLDRSLTLSIAHPIREFARTSMSQMMILVDNPESTQNIQLEFNIFTKENI